MKKLFLLFLFAVMPVVAMGQIEPYYDLDASQIISGSWEKIGVHGAQTYSFQRSTAVKYAAPPVIQTNVDIDVILKADTKGPNGSVSETNLTYGTLVCDKGGDLPEKFLVIGTSTFSVDKQGMPGSPRDRHFIVRPNSGQFVTIEQGSILANLAKTVCGPIHA